MKRRTILGAALAFSTGGAASAQSLDPLAGIAAPSESVQMGASSLDGAYQIVARICRYPVAGRTWVWVQVLTPEGFFAYFDHHAPCTMTPTDHSRARVQYEAEGGALLRATRQGPRLAPTRCTMRVRARLAATGAPREAEGWVPFEAEMELAPTRRYSGLLPDRSEVFGEGRMRLKVNGREFSGASIGQFHEQPQTSPRFSAPYSYASLWGPRTGITIVASARGGGGYRVSDTATEEYRSVAFPSGDTRAIVLSNEARNLTLESAARIHQQIPIFDGMWRGQFVRVRAPDEDLFGVVVDYERPSA